MLGIDLPNAVFIALLLRFALHSQQQMHASTSTRKKELQWTKVKGYTLQTKNRDLNTTTLVPQNLNHDKRNKNVYYYIVSLSYVPSSTDTYTVITKSLKKKPKERPTEQYFEHNKCQANAPQLKATVASLRK